MADQSEEKKRTQAKKDHVALTSSSVMKVSRWLEQIAAKRVRLSRKEFLNWFIEKSPENLSNSDLNAVVERYYDEEAFLRQLLREMKQSKKDGQTTQIEVVVRPRKNDGKGTSAPALATNEAEESN